jgi:glucose dehydrogenase
MVFQTGTERLGSLETTPIVVNGIMYFTSPAVPNNVVVAVDLRTQRTLWGYEHKNARCTVKPDPTTEADRCG